MKVIFWILVAGALGSAAMAMGLGQSAAVPAKAEKPAAR
ncbi:hypothetical protein M2336_001955 [Sphingobium sp. B1D7B]|nr:hypothetical protein [Sphingobium sp. B12D2B]MCW2365766.1 hypothetical protein [Sphingobium sp. B7D2B]MCW2370136.1 hypothetical protein [Sphingobium sp. B11D3D]MCW2381220.1 hypothetical protein [Sphingobium sp. B2D3B]MCW2388634.1 hypothetical protein [Sphingobium sp. B11D3B]MCW2393389.1 hypothetical protein [Sphingobium sp. B11D3A]MCW2395117.1 hypothetical protein [Sphingobium sp. B8D3B]MCW2398673.1 hypothetical protein [Sphingobium sp. B2D3C]MCW2405326.1 hypothetical protein [Sphingobiu